jgi:hypothetical protein
MREATSTQQPTSAVAPREIATFIPVGIRRSQEAFWRDLPALLKKKGNHGKWVAYHGDERIGIAAREVELLRKCRMLGVLDEEFYTDVIIQYDRPPWVPEPLDARPVEVESGSRASAAGRP